MASEFKYRFTVFTPCYNSEHFIYRVFNSLKSQTFRDFEWIVINDASTDKTSEVIENFIIDSDFDIHFFDLKENNMLMKNFNLAIEHAKGQFFLFADHDDEFKSNSLEVFDRVWSSADKENGSLAGIICNCIDQTGNLVGDEFPESPWICDVFNMRFINRIRGEKWAMYLTSILKEYPFPTVDRYVPESTVWFAIGDKYKSICINDALRIYYIEQKDHVSLSSQVNKYPNGMRHYYLSHINNRLFRILKLPKIGLLFFLNYTRMSIHAGIPFKQTLSDVNSIIAKLVMLILYLPGKAVAFIDRVKGKI